MTHSKMLAFFVLEVMNESVCFNKSDDGILFHDSLVTCFVYNCVSVNQCSEWLSDSVMKTLNCFVSEWIIVFRWVSVANDCESVINTVTCFVLFFVSDWISLFEWIGGVKDSVTQLQRQSLWIFTLDCNYLFLYWTNQFILINKWTEFSVTQLWKESLVVVLNHCTELCVWMNQ